jgi:hypothetical protein
MELYDSKQINTQVLEARLGKPVRLYERSVTSLGECLIALIRAGRNKYLVCQGSGPVFEELSGENFPLCKICPANHANRLVLNKYLPYTIPVANTARRPSLGLGDRLGEATAGHIEALKGTNVFPIFAQQSIRELNFTNRTFDDVIDAAAYAVFQEGYTTGYGADGDHLKKCPDIEKSLAQGATMITLDSSDQIDNSIQSLDEDALLARYQAVEEQIRELYERLYQEQLLTIGEYTLKLDRKHLMQDVLTYHKALDFIQLVYETYISTSPKPVDFEISIDETDTPTDPKSHLFIALELKRRHVTIATLAPRFIGEFQKGIDYIGDLSLFSENLEQHAVIARHFGYRLSIHSGSDKFSIFPILAKTIKGSFHVKTAGTNWLEAVRLVSQKDPSLYRRMHNHALKRFADAKKFYHVTTKLDAIRDLDEVQDNELWHYLEDDNARQLLHITYGYLLLDENELGGKLIGDELFDLLVREEEGYRALLAKHIAKHLALLGFSR